MDTHKDSNGRQVRNRVIKYEVSEPGVTLYLKWKEKSEAFNRQQRTLGFVDGLTYSDVTDLFGQPTYHDGSPDADYQMYWELDIMLDHIDEHIDSWERKFVLFAPSNRRMVTSTLKDYEWQIYGNDMEDVDAIREIFERKLRHLEWGRRQQ